VLLADDVLKELAARAQAHGDGHPPRGLVFHHVQELDGVGGALRRREVERGRERVSFGWDGWDGWTRGRGWNQGESILLLLSSRREAGS